MRRITFTQHDPERDSSRAVNLMKRQHVLLAQTEVICYELRKENEALEKVPPADSAIEDFMEILSTELQCTICGEVFIDPIHLSCADTVCSYCWSKEIGLRLEAMCPVCVNPAKFRAKALALDNFITKAVEMLGDEFKRERQALINGRVKVNFSQEDAARRS